MIKAKHLRRVRRLAAITTGCAALAAIPSAAQAFSPQPDPPRVASTIQLNLGTVSLATVGISLFPPDPCDTACAAPISVSIALLPPDPCKTACPAPANG